MTDNDKKKIDLDELAATTGDEDMPDIELSQDGQSDVASARINGHARDPIEELGAIYDVPVQLSAVLGKASMPVSQLLRLGRGAVLELDRKVGESIDILVNNRLVARGEVVIVDERIGITMTEIIRSDTA